MLSIIISSKTRIKLLIKFFLFDGNCSYLRSLEKEFHESSNSIRVELNRFLNAGLLLAEYKGKKRYYYANQKHPLYKDLKNIVRTTLGIKFLVDKCICKVGNLECAYITGNLAEGINSGFIELALVGTALDNECIDRHLKKVQTLLDRKIMYLTFTSEQMEYFYKGRPRLLIWRAGRKKTKNEGHLVTG
jgi:hypothetical protein